MRSDLSGRLTFSLFGMGASHLGMSSEWDPANHNTFRRFTEFLTTVNLLTKVIFNGTISYLNYSSKEYRIV